MTWASNRIWILCCFALLILNVGGQTASTTNGGGGPTSTTNGGEGSTSTTSDGGGPASTNDGGGSASNTPETCQKSATYCRKIDKGFNCTSVFTLSNELKLDSTFDYKHAELDEIDFIGGNPYSPSDISNITEGKNYACGFMVPTFQSLCDKNHTSKLLFVCRYTLVNETNTEPVEISKTIWPDFQEKGNLLTCASTRCSTSNRGNESTPNHKNPFYGYCINDNVTTYDNFMLYGNKKINEVILTDSHFCTLSIFTDTYVEGSNAKNNPLVYAGPATGDYGQTLNIDYKYIPNEQRWYKWFPGNETTAGVSVYWCTAYPGVKCNWDDHHIAMESHIRMVNMSKERHLPPSKADQKQISIKCPTGTEPAKNWCGYQTESECSCTSNDRCFKFMKGDQAYSGCASKVHDIIEYYKGDFEGVERTLVCSWLSPTSFNDAEKCFMVDLNSALKKICCCQSDCKIKVENGIGIGKVNNSDGTTKSK